MFGVFFMKRTLQLAILLVCILSVLLCAREWQSGTIYAPGDIVTYQQKSYIALLSTAGWPTFPPNTPGLHAVWALTTSRTVNSLPDISSEDESIVIDFKNESGVLCYSVSKDGVEIIPSAALGFASANYNFNDADIDNHYDIAIDSTVDNAEDLDLIHGKKVQESTTYKLYTLTCTRKASSGTSPDVDIEFRIFNDGFAYRYIIDRTVANTITDEYSSFTVRDNSHVLAQKWHKGEKPDFNDYEYPYNSKHKMEDLPVDSTYSGRILQETDPTTGIPLYDPVGRPIKAPQRDGAGNPILNGPRDTVWQRQNVSEQRDYTLPLLVAEAIGSDEYFILFSEADVDSNYCGARCHINGNTISLELSKNRDAVETPVNVIRNGETSFPTPWRVVVISNKNSFAKIVETTLIERLNPAPNDLSDFEWVKPGRSYYQMPGYRGYVDLNNAHLDGSGMGNPSADSAAAENAWLEILDFIQEMGWEYLTWDMRGWSVSTSDGSTFPGQWGFSPALNKAIAQAENSDIGIILWHRAMNIYELTQTPDALDNYFRELRANGIKGIWIDFINHLGPIATDQVEMNEFLEEVYRAAHAVREQPVANDTGLVVLLHGSNKQAGQQRTWPNLLAWESVIGHEHYAYGSSAREKGKRPSANTNTLLPFVKNSVGPIDFTPVTFNNLHDSTSVAHQSALPIIIQSGLSRYADHPSVLRANESFDFMKHTPVVWHDTRLVDGPDNFADLGKYVCLARRNNKNWFVGAIKNSAPEQLPIELKNLSFLNSDNNYYAYLIEDQVAANPDFTNGNQRITVRDVRRNQNMQLEPLRSRGGFAMGLFHEGNEVPSLPKPEKSFASGLGETPHLANVGDEITFSNVKVDVTGKYRVKIYYTRDESHVSGGDGQGRTEISYWANDNGVEGQTYFRGYRSKEHKIAIDVHLVAGKDNTISLRCDNIAGNTETLDIDRIAVLSEPIKSSILRKSNPGWRLFNVGDAGGVVTWDNGEYTISSRGRDIFGSSDEFAYMRKKATSSLGEHGLSFRFNNISGGNGNSKAGLMFRASQNANSKHVSLMVNKAGSLMLQYRSKNGEHTTNIQDIGNISLGTYIKFVNRNNVQFDVYTSTDGLSWGEPLKSIKVPLGNTLYAGVASSSNDRTNPIITEFNNFNYYHKSLIYEN